MIRPGQKAPDFELGDQFGRSIRLRGVGQQRHVLLIFYPKDFGARCSRALLRFEQLTPRLRELGVQPVAINADRAEVHAGWACSLGGLSYPVLGDDHPRGAVTRQFDLWRDDVELPDRAVVLVNPDGVVCLVDAPGWNAMFDFSTLLTRIESTLGSQVAQAPCWPEPQTLPAGTELFMKPTCPFCIKVGEAITNLHLDAQIVLRDISADPAAAAELEQLSGSRQVPCLLLDAEARLESTEIIRLLAERCAPLPAD